MADQDLAALWEEHCRYEFETRDVTATMATMVDAPYVNHVPTMTGGVGRDQLKRFYKYHFIGANPDDTRLIPISRTVGANSLVDEMLFCFTHTREIDWMLPGIPPTGRTNASIPVDVERGIGIRLPSGRSGGQHARGHHKAHRRGPARVERPRAKGNGVVPRRDIREHADACHGSGHGGCRRRVRDPSADLAHPSACLLARHGGRIAGVGCADCRGRAGRHRRRPRSLRPQRYLEDVTRPDAHHPVAAAGCG